MKLIIVKDYEEASQKACEIMLEQVKGNPNSNLGLATGSTPIRLYELMREDHKVNGTSYKNIKTFNLDEYYGLAQSHPQSYHYFMCSNLFNELDIDMNNVHVPKGQGSIEEECAAYNKLLKENVVDLQLLGIGSNGHIGFNEPGTSFTQETFIVKLAEKTREDNKRFFNSIDEVPTHAITMGIKNIMNAKKILMLISGASKADTVVRLLSEEIDTDFPASVLHKHPDVTVIIDQEAYSKM